MRDELVAKLTEKLSRPIVSEAEVVYVLVATRKLLDLCRISSYDLKPVRFFCDWVVHMELGRSPWAQELLSFADQLQSRFPVTALTPEEQAFMVGTFSLDIVRRKLIDFLRDQGVRTIVFGHTPGWYWFVRKFGAVISDCPLVLTGCDFASQVTLEILVGNGAGTRLDMEWTFRRTDRLDPYKWTQQTFFTDVGFGFGRRGKQLADTFNDELRRLGMFFPWEA